MSTKQDVLRLLYSTVDKPLSGQDIAEQLNLSRTAVWKFKFLRQLLQPMIWLKHTAHQAQESLPSLFPKSKRQVVGD